MISVGIFLIGFAAGFYIGFLAVGMIRYFPNQR